MFKKGALTKYIILLALILFISIIAINTFAEVIVDTKFTISQTKNKNQNLFSTSTVNNMEVVSETKNNLKVEWQPVFVGLVDKEYNITIENLEDKERMLDLGALFKALSGEVDTLVSGSIKLAYLTDLTKTVDDYSEVCTDRQVILSTEEPNQTTETVRSCTSQNNLKVVSYKGWKEYPINEARDKQKQEITLKKTGENGKITLRANSKFYLNLKFKTKIINRPDGTFGNDGQFGLLLDNVFFHPIFNISFNKRYLVNITANDAIDTNYTHNITFALTGNSNELGSATYTSGNTSLLACNNLHVFFNGTTELDAWTEGCNSSNFRVYFRNPVNITRNGTLLNSIEIYYDPVGANYQRPQDWGTIWLPPSDNFAAGLNASRWLVDNTTGPGNSTWINHSGTDGVIKIGIGLDAPPPAPDGCFRSLVNISQDNWAVEITYIRNTTFLFQFANNRAYGMNDRPCGVSPNANASGAYVYGDAPTQEDTKFELRTVTNGSFTTSSFGSKGIIAGKWETFIVNRTGTPYFANNRSGLIWMNTTGSIVHVSNTDNTAGSGSVTPLAFVLKEAIEPGVEATAEISMVDAVRVYQLIPNPPTYNLMQQNTTEKPIVTLNNPPNNTANLSISHTFNANFSDDMGLKNATLYHNIQGVWVANQTIDISGAVNSTNFSVYNIAPGNYTWNIQVCDTDETPRCNQAKFNFTFKVQAIVTKALEVKACTAEDKTNTANTYNDACEGTYPSNCGQNTTNDFLSCDDGNLETQTYRNNKFTGLHVQTFNSSITDCANITNVSLCYRWWVIGGNSVNCLVAVDSDANSSYSIVNTTCPNMVNATCPEASPTPLLVCTDITSLENWTCNSFFGTNGTRAVARTELSAPNPGPSQMLRTDALFFNVTYIET